MRCWVNTSATPDFADITPKLRRRAWKSHTRKQVVRALRAAGHQHGAGTVAKALADLTRSGELVNMLDKRGYRLPGWVRPTPGLFDDG